VQAVVLQVKQSACWHRFNFVGLQPAAQKFLFCAQIFYFYRGLDYGPCTLQQIGAVEKDLLAHSY
jgi:hypothetical protein